MDERTRRLKNPAPPECELPKAASTRRWGRGDEGGDAVPVHHGAVPVQSLPAKAIRLRAMRPDLMQVIQVGIF